MNKTFLLPENCYDRKIRFIAGRGDYLKETVRKLYNTKDETDEYDHGAYFTVEDNKKETISIIWVVNPTDYNSIAHECLHAVVDIFRDRGIELSETSEEAYTYFLGWLVEKILERM